MKYIRVKIPVPIEEIWQYQDKHWEIGVDIRDSKPAELRFDNRVSKKRPMICTPKMNHIICWIQKVEQKLILTYVDYL